VRVDDAFNRFWTDMTARLTGPMAVRLLLQPAVAALYGVRDGLRDARAGRPAYLWAIFNRPLEQRRLFHEGWRSTVGVVIVCAVTDVTYQLVAFRRVHALELVVVVLLVALVPYLLIRGPVNRLARRWLGPRRVLTP
jgi:hypothetical protein